MGILFSCQSIGKTYAARTLFDGLTFGVEEGDRIGLIGPNGSGKSTLLKMISSMVEPDNGSIVRRKDLRVSYVAQEESFPADESIEQIVTGSVSDLEMEDYVRAASIDSTIKLFGFTDRNTKAGSLSGGWKKKLALACGFARQPDLLILDEPTNHLDLQSVVWLEELLKTSDRSFIVVTHDRAFLEAISNRIVELNQRYPQGFLDVKGNYSEFLMFRETRVSEQLNLEQALASKVRREIAWLQRGARARQTKSSARINEAGKLIDELAEVKQRNTNAQIEIEFQASGRKTREIIVCKDVSKNYPDRPLFSNLELLITNKTRLGLIGRNGSGKTTLLRVIVGDTKPDNGQIKRAADLKIVWFDQNRDQLNDEKTLQESLCAEGDSVVYQGRSLHVSTYAKKFLFRAEQLKMPLSRLSGGEKSRILIAKLMLQTADVLILDEPTNDLDIPSLEVLEESLNEFSGAVILVTHDRLMLDEVSNQMLALDGSGGHEFFADYAQFEEASQRFLKEEKKAATRIKKTETAPRKQVGLSSPEKRDLEAIPKKIEEAESKLASIQNEMNSPDVSSNFEKLDDLVKQQEAIQQELEKLYSRWDELESKAASLRS